MTRTAGLATAMLGVVSIAAAQSTGPKPPPLVPTSLVGSTSFDLYCSSCHGRDAKGHGPVAPALRTVPADLTTLARRNGGTFPRDSVRAFIDGSARQVAHGAADMPVWGPTFRALEESGGRATVRLENLVAFIESIQLPPEGAAVAPLQTDGAALFRAHCASCHGSDGRGAGPMAAALKRVPPDLTRFASANGGVFPAERVARIIDGRTVAAVHGSSEMPIWGDTFRRSGRDSNEDQARARINALVTYLAGIQQRVGE